MITHVVVHFLFFLKRFLFDFFLVSFFALIVLYVYKISKRLAADLELVFSKTAAVVNQVKAVTSRVRDVAAGGGVEEEDARTTLPSSPPKAQGGVGRDALDPAGGNSEKSTYTSM